MDRNHPHAYEVRRSEFDEILFRNAANKGVECREGTRVSDIAFNYDDTVSVTAITEDEQPLKIDCQFLVDASGRESLLSRRKKLKSTIALPSSVTSKMSLDAVEKTKVIFPCTGLNMAGSG